MDERAGHQINVPVNSNAGWADVLLHELLTHEDGLRLRAKVLRRDADRVHLRLEAAEIIAAASEPGQGGTFCLDVSLRCSPTTTRAVSPLAAEATAWGMLPAVDAATPPVIDRQIGLKYAAGRPELYDRVLVRFCELHSRDGEALARALASLDRSTVHRLLHSLKGVAAMIGALGLRDEAARLEASCLAGVPLPELQADLPGIEALLAEVSAAIEVLRAELRQERQDPDAPH